MIGGISQHRKVVTFGVVLLASQLIGLLRSIVVARAVGPDVQGEATVINILAGFFSSVFVLNTAWQLVQSPSGEDADFRASLQGVTLIRGILSSLVIAVATWFLLSSLGYAHLRVPALVVSLVPLLDSTLRLDPWLQLRRGTYRSLLKVEIAGPIGSLFACSVALLFTQGVWVLVVAAVSASASRSLASHFISRGSWLLRIHREHVAELIRFGWPLIPAGLMYWLNSQTISIVLLAGDYVSWLPSEGLASLGAMSVVTGLAMLPVGLIGKLIQVLVVPKVSRVTDDERRGVIIAYGTKVMITAATAGLLGAICGPILAKLFLGSAYSVAFVAVPWLAGILGLRILRTFVYQVGVASGETRTQLLGNTARLSALPMTVLALGMGGGLQGVAFAGFLAEILAVSVTGRRGGPISGLRRTLLFWLVVVVSSVLIGWVIATQAGLTAAIDPG